MNVTSHDSHSKDTDRVQVSLTQNITDHKPEDQDLDSDINHPNESSKILKTAENISEQQDNTRPISITAAGPPQTGAIVEKKVRFNLKPEIFHVESYKKYNQFDYKESCCECKVF